MDNLYLVMRSRYQGLDTNQTCATCGQSADACKNLSELEKEMERPTENDLLRRGAVLMTVEDMYKACDGNIEDFHDLLIECFKVLPPHVEDD